MPVSLPKIHTDLLWYLAFTFGSLGVLCFIFVFFFRNRLRKRAALVSAKKKEIAPLISQFLFIEEAASPDERKEYLNSKVEIRELIKTRFNREVLAEILLDLQKDVSGEARQHLYDLYKNLGLHQDAFTKLRSWRWEVVSAGISELTQMRVEESYLFIRRFINHRRGVIRKQAQIAAVTLKHEGISYFLDTCKYQISEWQQLKLLDVLRHLEDFTPPRFKIWLTSKNKDVVLFALRLIRYYSQNDANKAIVQLIKHRNSQIKVEAIQCLKEFGVTEAIDALKATFRKCNNDAKIAVLDAIAELGEQKDIEFLRKVEHSDENFLVRSKALSAINTIDPESIMPSEHISEPTAADLEFANDMIDVDKSDTSEETHHELHSEEVQIQEDHVIISELEEENVTIFDLCVQEEIKDILDEAKQEEEPEYLSLDFLPVVKKEVEPSTPNPGEEQLWDLENNTTAEEEVSKKNLGAILNKITMKDDQHKSEHENEIPDFLPLVVDDQKDTEARVSSVTALDIDVEAEIISVLTESHGGQGYEESGYMSLSAENILETEVIAETLPWQDLLENIEYDELISFQPENEVDAELNQELTTFSIFREMFRDFDAESKLILLDEILVVGEEKELNFLGTLSQDPDRRVRRKAEKIRTELAAKLGISTAKPIIVNQAPDQVPSNATKSRPIISEGQIITMETVDDTRNRIPLEYCFLDDPDKIYPSEKGEESDG